MTTTDVLLAAYDQLRVHVPDRLPPRWEVERADPVVRLIEPSGLGHVCYRPDGVLADGVPDDLIRRERDVFAERGEPVEWTLHGHDRPSDLADRLRAAGFTPTVDGTVLVAEAAAVAREPVLPPGVRLREVESSGDFQRIAALYNEVWDIDHTLTMAGILREQRDVPGALTMVAAETDEGEVVSAGWIRFVGGSAFATLWGGSTAEPWRGKGIYRALVAYRATLAVRRGHRYVQITASEDSRPILEHLGMTAVTTATPYLWTPDGGTR